MFFYGIGIISLLGLFAFGKTIKGQTNWYQFGGFGFQPSEFVKTATALLLAKYLSYSQINLKFTKHQLMGLAIIGLPIFLILLQPDAGSAMIFIALIFVLNREGLPSWYFLSGIVAIVVFFLIPSNSSHIFDHHYFDCHDSALYFESQNNEKPCRIWIGLFSNCGVFIFG